jgi:hypothetical protein
VVYGSLRPCGPEKVLAEEARVFALEHTVVVLVELEVGASEINEKVPPDAN